MNPSLSTNLLARLREFLNRRLGFEFPPTRGADLERGIHAASKSFGFGSVEECLEWLFTSALTRAEFDQLVSHFTVGETHFFREPEVFERLEREILPELIRERRSGNRQLRLWSAGCASGEEAYSLAVVLARALPDLPTWRTTILATDVNQEALSKAALGVYGEWSFRVSPPWFKARYFTPTEDGCYRIDPAIQAMISFSRLNLAEDPYPALSNGAAGIDVVFCRNVLLYFSREQAEAVTRRFYECMNDRGWLVGGTAEHFRAPGFVPVEFGGRPLFRKLHQPSAPVPAPILAPSWSEAVEVEAPRGDSPIRTPAASVVPPDREPLPSHAELARLSADRGALVEALRYCDAAIRDDRSEPAHQYLRATILAEMDDLPEAEAAFRRTLYLDSNFIMAHFAMATLATRSGRPAVARKHLENASRLLAECGPDDPLPGSAGITAQRLAELAKSLETEMK